MLQFADRYQAEPSPLREFLRREPQFRSPLLQQDSKCGRQLSGPATAQVAQRMEDLEFQAIG